MDNASQGTHVGDSYGRAHGFSVEITGGEALEGNEGSWLSVSHSGLTFEIEDVTVGSEQYQTKAIGRKKWGSISLSGHLTKSRNAVKDIYKDMLEKGGESEVYRTITVNWIGPNGDVIHKVDFNECFLIDWSISELDSNQENVPCIEYSTWQVGFSMNFLKSDK